MHEPDSPQNSVHSADSAPSTTIAATARFVDGAFQLQKALPLPAGTPLTLTLGPGLMARGSEARTVRAVLHGRRIETLEPLPLPEGTVIDLEVAVAVSAVASPRAPEAAALDVSPTRGHSASPRAPEAATAPPPSRPGLLSRVEWGIVGGLVFFYLLTRLVGLTAFPIYFFSDEAMQTNLARTLAGNGFRIDGVLLPTYFRNIEKYNLSLSVYIHLIGNALFGTSVFATRLVSVLVSVLAVVGVALTLKIVFQQRYWWAGALALSAMPVWFLHSRTAFETVMMVAFYAGFLCAYLLYRTVAPRFLIAAIVLGGATFYSYSNGQGVMLVSGVLLLLSDAAYHWRTLRARPRLAGAALVTALLVAAPYLRFRLTTPDAVDEHLRNLRSYWLSDMPLADKLFQFGQNYAQGLSPGFWFVPNDVDLDRHVMLGWGNIPLLFLPFVAAGLLVCLWRWRSSAHRAVLIAVLAAPFSAALVIIHNYRALAMVVPAALLFGIGLEALVTPLRRRVPHAALAGVLAAGLLGLNGLLLRTALVDGPTWFRDYSLYGMQWGAPQLFGAVATRLNADPDTLLVISPTWANNGNAFIPFFLTPEEQRRVRLDNINRYLLYRQELRPDELFVLTAEEHDHVASSGKLLMEQPEQVLPYPDGRPGFYFVRLRYADTFDAIVAAEREANTRPVDATLLLDGEQVPVRHSVADIGDAAALVDGKRESVLRGKAANPLLIDMTFPTPRSLTGLALYTWDMELVVTVTATTTSGATLSVERDFGEVRADQLIEVPLSAEPALVSGLRVEVHEKRQMDEYHIHVGELFLR